MSRITLIGPGAIGCAIGGALLEAGHDVTFCARTAFSRLSVGKGDAAPAVYPAKVVTAPASVPPADWVLVCVKTYQVAAAARWLHVAIGPGTKVAVLQNGVEHRENVEPLVPAGTEVVPVVVDLPARRTAPGTVVWQRLATVATPDDAAGRAFCALFADSFVMTGADGDFISRAWAKLCINAPAGAVLALTGRPMGVLHAPGVADVARAILGECIAVGRAEGASFGEEIIDPLMAGFLAAKPDDGNSMYADRIAGREMEWDARNGVIVRKAARHGIAVPVSAALVPLLAAISDAAKKG